MAREFLALSMEVPVFLLGWAGGEVIFRIYMTGMISSDL